MNHQWMAWADRDLYHGEWMLGEDENGDLFVPGRTQDAPWRRFNPRNPLHWLAYWKSKRVNSLAWLEAYGAL